MWKITTFSSARVSAGPVYAKDRDCVLVCAHLSAALDERRANKRLRLLSVGGFQGK